MRKNLLILCTLFIWGLATIGVSKEYYFKNGRYLLETQWDKGKIYKFYVLIENNGGDLEFIDPYNGSIIMGGAVEDNKFILKEK